MTLQGVDVASYQGLPDWPTVAAAGYAFCLIKASEGTGYVNPTFAPDWAASKAAGLTRGAYYFAQPSQDSAAAAAAYFLAAVAAAGGFAPGDLIALDIETGDGDLLAWVTEWLNIVTQATGCRPFLYSNAADLTAYGLLDPAIGGYGLWLASYSASAPVAPAPWTFWAVWQNSDSATVPGVAGACDTDVFNGDASQLALYGVPQPAPVPAKLPFDTAARLAGCGYLAGGSGVTDMTAWLAGYEDVSA